MNPLYECGRMYKHKETNKTYKFLYFDSDRPHSDVVMYDPFDIDPTTRETERYTFSPDEFRDMTMVEDIDNDILIHLLRDVEIKNEEKTTVVDGVEVLRKCFSINPSGRKVDKSVFDDWVRSYPHTTRINYWNADVYKVQWLGKERWIGMYHRETYTYYIID
jgi:hypothetical protein